MRLDQVLFARVWPVDLCLSGCQSHARGICIRMIVLGFKVLH